EGNGLHQLNGPTDVLTDKETDSLIVCDYGNRRVVRWSRRSGTTQGEILIDNINCYELAMDEQRNLYVSDTGKHEVRRYQLDKKNYTLVAGGNGQGDGLNQLNWPTSKENYIWRFMQNRSTTKLKLKLIFSNRFLL
ncbi:unnamed protein product, partial [Rotaria socialis]